MCGQPWLKVRVIYDYFILFGYVMETTIIVGTNMVVHNIEPLWKWKAWELAKH